MCFPPILYYSNRKRIFKKKFGKNPKIVTYIDGPFYPDESLDLKNKKIDLRNKVYNQMCERSTLNTVELIKYIKKEEVE